MRESSVYANVAVARVMFQRRRWRDRSAWQNHLNHWSSKFAELYISKFNLGNDCTVARRYFVARGRWGHASKAVANCHFLGKLGWQNGKVAGKVVV